MTEINSNGDPAVPLDLTYFKTKSGKLAGILERLAISPIQNK